MYLLDTNICIAILRKDENAVDNFSLKYQDCYLVFKPTQSVTDDPPPSLYLIWYIRGGKSPNRFTIFHID